MTVPFSGGCACDAIRYTCNAAPVATLNCHCTSCQRASGAPFASGFIVAHAATEVRGTPVAYETTGNSGGKTTRTFCGQCGTPLFTRGEVVPDFMSIRFPTLDDFSDFKPVVDIWTSSAQPWMCFDEATTKFAESP